MNGAQCKMARVGLGWKSRELADRAGVSYPTLHRFESGQVIADESRDLIEKALAKAGAQFIQRGGRLGATVPQ